MNFTSAKPSMVVVGDELVVGTAFGLDTGRQSGMLDTKNGIYFVKAIEHTKADSAAFVKDRCFATAWKTRSRRSAMFDGRGVEKSIEA